MFETARLRLRLLRIEEATSMLGGDDEPGWAKGYPTDAALVEAGLVVMAAREGQALGDFGSYQMVRKSDGRVVGTCSFMGPPGRSGFVEVGAGVVAAERGRGYETEALRELVGWAFQQPGVRRVTATLYDD